MTRLLLVSAPLLLLLPTAGQARRPTPVQTMEEVAADLLGRGLQSTEAYEELRYLSDHIGHRLSGSPQLDAAIAWGVEEMKADGLRVHTEPVQVPRWIRGEQFVALTAPMERTLDVLTLGNSVGTNGEDVSGPVVAVSSWEEFEALPDEAIRDHIVLYDVPFTTYGKTVQFRGDGPSRAASRGAVATFVRSVTPVSLGTPHTGSLRYDEEQPKIPGVALTIEDATWIHRMLDHGETVTATLRLGAHFEADVPSANVVGEIRGRERPDQVVLLGCHLDAWDVGQGSQDDGAGCVIVMEAARLIAELPVRPRRTVRVVLFTNEENGLRGGTAYSEAHLDENIIAAIESDTGAGWPTGFGVDVRDAEGNHDDNASDRLAQQMQRFVPLLDPIDASTIENGWSGADIGPTVARGIPGFGLRHDMTGYWPIHHTRADTFDKIDPKALAKNVAAMTVFAWALAEDADPFGSGNE